MKRPPIRYLITNKELVPVFVVIPNALKENKAKIKAFDILVKVLNLDDEHIY